MIEMILAIFSSSTIHVAYLRGKDLGSCEREGEEVPYPKLPWPMELFATSHSIGQTLASFPPDGYY